jgi:hypothetical protein
MNSIFYHAFTLKLGLQQLYSNQPKFKKMTLENIVNLYANQPQLKNTMQENIINLYVNHLN